jgi:hypothetical protein
MPDYMPASDPEFDLWQKTLATWGGEPTLLSINGCDG